MGLLVLQLLLSGCLGGRSELPIGALCASANSCEGTLVCIYGRCRPECTYDRDCDDGQGCVESSTSGERVCTVSNEGTAGAGEECPEGLLRGPDDICREPCEDEGICALDRLCVDGTCLEAEGCDDWELEILSNEDDGEIDDNSFWDEGEPPDMGDGLMMGWWIGGSPVPGPTWGFFRFRLPGALPSDALLREVRLSLWGKDPTEGWSSSEHALRIWLEESDDAEVVTEEADVPLENSDRSFIDDFQLWPETGGLEWLVDETNVSPDLSSLLEDLLLTRSGLADGSHIQFWLAGYFEGDSVYVDAEVATEDWSENSGEGDHARLTISFCQ